ncbi:MAG: UvrB/UvrC motif-containing protein [Phycisphaeraceae bacterium]|nr:UvrB/UvrC motif-containing protein [Phycisphaeraceae bacterium]
MKQDLSQLLTDWPFVPGQLNVRMIVGQDGEPRIQIRLDLGILQLLTRGRPDGTRPQGYPSLLEFYEAKLAALEAGSGAEAPDEPETAGGDGATQSGDAPAQRFLDEDDCKSLREEMAQYYHRFMALLALEDYEGVVRDTTRNLRVIDLCEQYAIAENDRSALEPYRPYVMMVRARALAGQALKDNEPKAALLAIDEGLTALKGYFAEVGEPDAFDSSSEVGMLRSMRDALVPKLPVSQKAELRRRLQAALERENYELAAILRDELRLLPEDG